ncbi:hypothetical protein COB72_01300 [bacterium]|nr:MAG: hypothetical protein COB72_01300 [bacterium]
MPAICECTPQIFYMPISLTSYETSAVSAIIDQVQIGFYCGFDEGNDAIVQSGVICLSMVVSTRVLGKRKPLLADFSVPPPIEIGDGGEVTLRKIIEHIVHSEVAKFDRRQELFRFDRVLSKSQIDHGVGLGKVDPAKNNRLQSVDAEEAVGTALMGFIDGLYLVIIDEVERKCLDEVIRLSPTSHITFIRLVFLAGA